jgi:hypothetical protein
MSCIVFCRPTSINIELLVEELRAPRYSEYRLCTLGYLVLANLSFPVSDFSNFLKNAHVERLAEADQAELVKDVKVRIDRRDVACAYIYIEGVLCRLPGDLLKPFYIWD